MSIKDLIEPSIRKYCIDWTWSAESEFSELANGVIDRMDDDDLLSDDFYEALFQAMDESLIYTDDQWKMLELYCTPRDANFDDAWEQLESDIAGIIRTAQELYKEEEAE